MPAIKKERFYDSFRSKYYFSFIFVFALEIFRQLSLISFEGGKIEVFRGVKTQLSNSELYNIVKEYENGIR